MNAEEVILPVPYFRKTAAPYRVLHVLSGEPQTLREVMDRLYKKYKVRVSHSTARVALSTLRELGAVSFGNTLGRAYRTYRLTDIGERILDRLAETELRPVALTRAERAIIRKEAEAAALKKKLRLGYDQVQQLMAIEEGIPEFDWKGVD